MDERAYSILKRTVDAIERPKPELLTYYLLLSLSTLFLFPVTFVSLWMRYSTLRYRFDDEGVSMGYGVFFRREVNLTFSRMQDIHLSQNLLERWLGIGTVTIQTAGGGSGGDLAIVGVYEYEAIRDYLYARMRGIREQPRPAASLGGTERILEEIRDELRAAARALGGGAR